MAPADGQCSLQEAPALVSSEPPSSLPVVKSQSANVVEKVCDRETDGTQMLIEAGFFDTRPLMPRLGGTPIVKDADSHNVPVQASSLGWTFTTEEVRRQARGVCLISLFHGPLGREDGLEVFVSRWGAQVAAFDLETSPEHDLCDDTFWSRICEDLEAGVYDAGGMAMPCGTFSPARSWDDGGPTPLRGEFAPEIFGFKGLDPEDKEKVRIGTLLALRGAEAAGRLMRLHLPFWGETPHMRDGKPSVFKLPAWLEIRQAPGVDTTAFAQCGLGARTEKMTDIVNYDLRIAFPSACTHPKRWWAVPWSGRARWGSHPQLKGTQWMVPWEEWDAT